MIVAERTFDVAKQAPEVIDYLADFAHAEQWDPGTKTCTRTSDGPVAVGTTWRNVSVFRGRETELRYELIRREPDHLTFRGTNKTATSVDDITVRSRPGGGATITYRAEISFHGLVRLAEPFLKREFEKLGDETRDRIQSVVAGL